MNRPAPLLRLACAWQDRVAAPSLRARPIPFPDQLEREDEPQTVLVARQREVDKVPIDLEMELRGRAVSRPPTLYLFEHDKRCVERVLQDTIVGGVTGNDANLHIAKDSLPVGGVGPSGMGQYHGHRGFETFSETKAVFR